MVEGGAATNSPSKSARVKDLHAQGKSYKEIARILYNDETEIGQRKVRALISKLRRKETTAGTSISSKGSEAITTREEASQPGCGGVVRNSFVCRNLRNLDSQPSEVVRAPCAGLGSRVSYVLERDVITAIICDSAVAVGVRRLATRVTGAGFYVYHHDGVAFQSKGDVVAVSEPNGDIDRAASVLREVLKLAGFSDKEADGAALRLKHPSQIAYDELTVEIRDPKVIQLIRRCEPFIPDPGRGPYVVHAPSPLIPGLKIYLVSESQLRVELLAHSEKQAFNALFIRGEFVGDVLPRVEKAPGVFDEWRAQYWHPYSHPIVINLSCTLAEPTRDVKRGAVVFDLLPQKVRGVLKGLRDKGVLWYNDYRSGLSGRFLRVYRRDPSKIVEQLERAEPLERSVVELLTQKVVVDHETLLKHLKLSEREAANPALPSPQA